MKKLDNCLIVRSLETRDLVTGDLKTPGTLCYIFWGPCGQGPCDQGPYGQGTLCHQGPCGQGPYVGGKTIGDLAFRDLTYLDLGRVCNL